MPRRPCGEPGEAKQIVVMELQPVSQQGTVRRTSLAGPAAAPREQAICAPPVMPFPRLDYVHAETLFRVGTLRRLWAVAAGKTLSGDPRLLPIAHPGRQSLRRSLRFR